MTLNFPSAAAAGAYEEAATAEGHKVEVGGATRIVTRQSFGFGGSSVSLRVAT